MPETSEFEILQGMLPQLTAEGYEVYIRPGRALLPPFMHGYTPDAVAFRSDKNLAIEVSRRAPDRLERIQRADALFRNQPKWELRVVWLDPATSIASVPVLLGWATFEATARAMLTERLERPQTAGRLLEILASDGYVTPSAADRLRVLAEKRNKLAHGEFQVGITQAELSSFCALIESLREPVDN
jgi:hypothetical protein